ncbi:MAG: hypothetical protein WKG01_14270 [Kofleriaceae bacterium]
MTSPAPPTTSTAPLASSSTTACSADGWCWLGEPGNDLHAVWAASPSDAWAVGDHGTVLHFDGRSWGKIPFPSTQPLLSVVGSTDAAGSRRVWVGTRAGIYTWNGQAFVQPTHPPRSLGAVFALAARGAEVWAGVDHLLLRDAGDGKGLVQINVADRLRGRITALALAGDGSALVGVERAKAQKFEPAGLVRIWPPSAPDLPYRVDELVPPVDVHQMITALQVLPSGDLVVANASYPRAWTSRGAAWQPISLRGVSGGATTRVAGDGTPWIAAVGLYRGGGVAPVSVTGAAQLRLRDVAVAGGTIFAVGALGAAVVVSGGDVRTQQPAALGTVGGVGRDPTSGAIVVIGESGGLWRWTARGIETVASAPAPSALGYTYVTSIGDVPIAIRHHQRDGFSPSHAEVARWTTGGWSRVHDAPNIQLTQLASAGSTLWAVGRIDAGATRRVPAAGVVLRGDATKLARVRARLPPLVGIAPINANEAFVVGEGGLAWIDARGGVRKLAGLAEVRSPVAVWAAGPDEVFVLGEYHVAHVRSGVATVTELEPDLRLRLFAIAGRSATDVTIVGDGVVHHFDGKTWRREDVGTSDWLVGVAYASDGTTVVTSQRGVTLRHPPR